jgi:hypothetical protein
MSTVAHIYALVDASGAPRYIGETADIERRRHTHFYNRRFGRTTPVKEWLLSLDEAPDVVLLDTVDFSDRYDLEEFYSVGFRWAGASLLNMNDGIRPGPETRARVSASKTAEVRARVSAKLTGRIVTEETRARISASVRAHNERRRAVTADAA